MENIYALQEKAKEYLQRKLKDKYSFDVWKDTLVSSRNRDADKLKEIWNIFGDDFELLIAYADVRASGNEWDACLVLEFGWNYKGNRIVFRLTLVNDELRFVEVTDMFAVSRALGEEVDLANEFEKNVILIDALKN